MCVDMIYSLKPVDKPISLNFRQNFTCIICNRNKIHIAKNLSLHKCCAQYTNLITKKDNRECWQANLDEQTF